MFEGGNLNIKENKIWSFVQIKTYMKLVTYSQLHSEYFMSNSISFNTILYFTQIDLLHKISSLQKTD